jgi:hypothetical protein
MKPLQLSRGTAIYRGSGGSRLPRGIIAKHGVKGSDHFSHDGDDDDLGFLVGVGETIGEGPEGGICFDCEPRPDACHIKENIRTGELGADSAHCRHSAARSLHFSGLSIATPSGDPTSSKIKPRLDRGDQRGFLRSASAGAKLFSKLGT